MSARTCRDGLHVVFSRVAPSLSLIVGEPDSLGRAPALYTILDDFDAEYTDNGHLKSVTWRFLHRLCVTYQDNAAAEDSLLDLTQAILDAVAADPKLGGLLHHNGQAMIRAGDAGFTPIPKGSSTTYRTCDLSSEVLEVTGNG